MNLYPTLCARYHNRHFGANDYSAAKVKYVNVHKDFLVHQKHDLMVLQGIKLSEKIPIPKGYIVYGSFNITFLK